MILYTQWGHNMQTAQHTKHIVFDKHSSGISDGLKQVAYESKNGGASVVSEERGVLVVVVVGKGQLADKSHYCRLDGDTHTTQR